MRRIWVSVLAAVCLPLTVVAGGWFVGDRPDPAVAAPAFSTADVVDEFVAGGSWYGVVSADWLPDGRMLGTQLAGGVLVINPANGTSSTYFTIPDVLAEGEVGLLDITVDPDFATNRFFYTYFTDRVTRRLAVDRFRFEPTGAATLATRTTVWRSPGLTVAGTYHVGGSIDIGPDGKLYISTGDNLFSANSQSLTNVFGKVMRINLDGSVPTDNPFYDGAGTNVDEIWAYGLRNAYRAGFDDVTGEYWVGDVGGNTDATAYEEISIVEAGQNHGWPNCEGPVGPPKNGPSCPPGTTGPVYAYTHVVGQGCCQNRAVVGGAVYRGDAFPAEFEGTYVYADYPTGEFYWLERGPGGVSSGLLKDSTLSGVAQPVWLDVSPIDGHIYWLNIGSDGRGQLRRLRHLGTGERPPTIEQASATPTAGSPPLTVAFTGVASDPDGDALAFEWDFGDGTTSTLASPSHVYTAAGTYEARLTVQSGPDIVAAPPVTIVVGTPPVPVIQPPSGGTGFTAGTSITLQGTATDAEDGPLPGSALAWTVVFLHNEHSHPAITGTGSSIVLPVPTTGHGYEGDTGFLVTLTATDSDGVSGTTSLELVPNKVEIELTANVDTTVTVDGVVHDLPFVVDTLTGFEHTVSVPASVCDGETRWNFGSWSDGGDRVNTFEVGPADAQLTATYVDGGSCASEFLRAVNLNGPALFFDGTPFDAAASASYLTAGPGSFCNQTVALVPVPATAEEAEAVRCSVWGGGTNGPFARIGGLASGTYLVEAWVWEDNSAAPFELRYEGTPVATVELDGAGSWQRVGPFSVPVTDGTLDITTSGSGDVNLSAVRVRRAPAPPTTTSSVPATTSPAGPTTTAPTVTEQSVLDYVPVAPDRVLETRSSAGQVGYAGDKPVAEQVVELDVTRVGASQVPDDARAVVLNVTATEASADGFVTVWPCGAPRPNASNLNLTAGGTRANLVVVQVGGGGRVCVFTETGTHLLADVQGYVPASSTLVPVVPDRVLETRSSAGQVGYAGDKPVAEQVVELDVTRVGASQVPDDARAVVLNVTATEASADGFVTVWPCGAPRPNASNLNLTAGGTVAAAVVARVGSGGRVCLFTETGTHLLADVQGYVPAVSTFVPVVPDRVLETRSSAGQVGYTGDKPVATQVVALDVTGVGTAQVPASVTAVVLTVTGTEATADGYVTVWPCGAPKPAASNLNLVAGGTAANTVIVPPGAGGQVCLFTETGTHLLADVAGYWL